MKDKLIGYCGLDCSKCPIYIADRKNDNNQKEQIAEEWSIQFKEYIGKKLSVDDIHCEGCKAKDDKIFIGCDNCPIRICSVDKGKSYCIECDIFKSCEKIQGFFLKYEDAKVNLNKIKKQHNKQREE